MADYGLFIGWGPDSVRGREAKSLEVFNESVEYWGRLQQEGRIESFEVAFLEPHGGDLGGFALLRGDREAIAALRFDDEFMRITTRATLIVENLGIVGAFINNGLSNAVSDFQEAIADLT
jgi:hypothetical protein